MISELFDDPKRAKKILLDKLGYDPGFGFKELFERQTEARKKRDAGKLPSEIWILDDELDESSKPL